MRTSPCLLYNIVIRERRKPCQNEICHCRVAKTSLSPAHPSVSPHQECSRQSASDPPWKVVHTPPDSQPAQRCRVMTGQHDQRKTGGGCGVVRQGADGSPWSSQGHCSQCDILKLDADAQQSKWEQKLASYRYGFLMILSCLHSFVACHWFARFMWHSAHVSVMGRSLASCAYCLIDPLNRAVPKMRVHGSLQVQRVYRINNLRCILRDVFFKLR